jgi:hypothetical protein
VNSVVQKLFYLAETEHHYNVRVAEGGHHIDLSLERFAHVFRNVFFDNFHRNLPIVILT